MTSRALLLALGSSLVAAPVAAQALPEQDASLAGVRAAHVVLVDESGVLRETTEERLFSAATLELRKAGLRVVPPTEAEADGALLLHFSRDSGAPAATLRTEFRQRVEIDRTGREHVVGTWTSETSVGLGFGADVDADLRRAVDTFLAAYLTANGR